MYVYMKGETPIELQPNPLLPLSFVIFRFIILYFVPLKRFEKFCALFSVTVHLFYTYSWYMFDTSR